MITKAKTLTAAASYIRMSSDKQERSPAQQKAEITKLAKVEGCYIVREFKDEAITGDSGPEKRPGFRAMLESAERGEFQVLLVENGDRIGRFNSMRGAEHYNRLIDAGIRIVTCSDGEIYLTTFEGRVVHTVRQEGRHAFLRDHSRKVVRGQAANAKAGNSNGGAPPYGFDRAQVDPSGKIVRRLAKKERSSVSEDRVRAVPCTDNAKLDAVRYMFNRFLAADIGYRALAIELDAKGFPSPTGKGWQSPAVAAILRSPSYCGKVRSGARTMASYHTNAGDEIVSTSKPSGGSRYKPIEDAVIVASGEPGIIDQKIFDRVQRRIVKRSKKGSKRAVFPLAGLIVCEHCGAPMHGSTVRRKDRNGKSVFEYRKYVCGTYSVFGKQGGRIRLAGITPSRPTRFWVG